MNSNFYYFSSKLLNQSFGISRPTLPNISHAEVVDDKVQHDTIHISLIKEHPITIPVNLFEIVLFSVIDSLVDIKKPELIGESFKKKYEGLQSRTNLEIIFKECYRFLKLIRNAAIHNKDTINRDSEYFEIHLPSRSSTFKLKCHHESTRHLFNLCLLFIENMEMADSYFTLVMLHYYNQFICDIIEFNDEFGGKSSIVRIPQENKFYPYQRYRYRVSYLDLNFSEDFLIIKRKNGKYSIFAENIDGIRNEYKYDNCDEYFFEDNQGIKYLVPGHALDEEGKIPLANLSSWKVGNKIFNS